MTTIETLKNYFESEKRGALEGIGDDDSLLDAGVLDSLGIVRLLVFLEQSFSVSVPDDELDPDNFESLNAIASLIDGKQAG